jgi:large subunit ribosomal protein L7/L12|tara:strand:+ start:163 stop:546 length:384 start_codon:yes stop_codon:yes gene_type:complete
MYERGKMSQVDTLVEQLGKLTVLEAGDLAKKLEKAWNLNYEQILQGAKPQVVEEVVEDTLLKVILTGYGENKIAVIKEIRKIKDMGLMEAKNFVEGAPQEIKGDIEKEEAEKIKAEIETVGGTVEIK